MYRKLIIGLVGICTIGVLAFGTATPASALTLDEIQTKITELLKQVQELTRQINALKEARGGSPINPADDPQCKVWFDGCNTCSRSTPGGPGMCTLMACTNPTESSSHMAAYCREKFTDGTPPVTPPQRPGKPRICFILPSYFLSVGSTGDVVSGLQEFLRDEGFMNDAPTGYFGSITSGAIAKWQSAWGIDPAGTFGPISRGRLKAWCEGGDTVRPISQKFSASPTRGIAPLTVTFKAMVDVAGPLVADAGSYKIVFGDGAEHVIPCSEVPTTNAPNVLQPTGFCKGPHIIQHTYATNGTYTATLVHYGYYGVAGSTEQTIGSMVIVVGPKEDPQPTACTMEYAPVCGLKPVVCIKAPCNPVPTTYSNRCMMKADGASLAYEGQCRTEKTCVPRPACLDTTPRCMIAEPVEGWCAKDPANDPTCQSWYDGCNTCSRSTPGGPGMCTMEACLDENNSQPPRQYCKAHFTTPTTPTACTREYAPVCGQPPMPYCDENIACTAMMPPPKTYSNRCMMTAENAAFLSDGVCSSVGPPSGYAQ